MTKFWKTGNNPSTPRVWSGYPTQQGYYTFIPAPLPPKLNRTLPLGSALSEADDGKQREHKDKRGFGKQVARLQEEWIPVNVPAIIDPEIFALAQKRKAYLTRLLGGHAKNDYLMKSRLTCSKCGYAMRGQAVNSRSRTKKHFYYLCNGRRKIVCLCDMPTVRGDWVDELVWEWVKMIIDTPIICVLAWMECKTNCSKQIKPCLTA